jgi:Tol biopolymer transport system component
LLESSTKSLSNPRVSPDGQWIAFDGRDAAGRTDVFIAKAEPDRPLPESQWVLVAQGAGQPFWSFQGSLLYYVAGSSIVRARRIALPSGQPEGDAVEVYSSPELRFPSWLPGTTPVATPNLLMFILADLRGDVWVMDLARRDAGNTSR